MENKYKYIIGWVLILSFLVQFFGQIIFYQHYVFIMPPLLALIVLVIGVYLVLESRDKPKKIQKAAQRSIESDK